MPLSLTIMMIPKELIEKQRKAEDVVNRTHERMTKAVQDFEDAKESLRKIQIEIAAILDGHADITKTPETSTQ
jgi:hypothetical protein